MDLPIFGALGRNDPLGRLFIELDAAAPKTSFFLAPVSINSFSAGSHRDPRASVASRDGSPA